MEAAEQFSGSVGTQPACSALGVPRASLYRKRQALQYPQPAKRRRRAARALSAGERQQVLDLLHSERFVDQAPAPIYATLLDEGSYLCSIRSMCRILSEQQEVRERRHQLTHPPHPKPELLATEPNALWSWDITKLKGPVKWTYFYLYVILDVFSRYVVGWMVAHRERAALARKLIATSCQKQNIEPGQLTVHADRGSSMTSKPVALLLSDLGVTKTHSRPYTSNDNPFSESQFKTLKYRPEFPQRFGCIEDARAFCRNFFPWYNREPRHSGIGLLTPQVVHYGLAECVIEQRQQVLKAVHRDHPERFVNGHPKPPVLPQAVWINPPERESKESENYTNLENQSVSKLLTRSKGSTQIGRTLTAVIAYPGQVSRDGEILEFLGAPGRPWFESFPSCSPTWLRNLREKPVIECQDMKGACPRGHPLSVRILAAERKGYERR